MNSKNPGLCHLAFRSYNKITLEYTVINNKINLATKMPLLEGLRKRRIASLDAP